MKAEFTEYHNFLLGVPKKIEHPNILVYDDNKKIEQFLKNAQFYNECTSKNEVDSNTFCFLQLTENNNPLLICVVYFYNYPNEADNGFLLFKLPNFSYSDEIRTTALFKILSSVGLDINSDSVAKQLKKYK